MVPVPTTPQPATCAPARACWLRAWDRAKAEKLIPYPNPDGSWAVKSYTITPTGPGWSDLACSCPGNRHAACKHRAVVAKALASHVRPIRGTAKAGKAGATPAASFVPSHVALAIPTPLDALFA